MRLCEEHDVQCSDTNAGFYDKHHQLRSHFYKPQDNIHLSWPGIKRVLGIINEKLHIVENFEQCVYPINSQPKKPTGYLQSIHHRRNQYFRTASHIDTCSREVKNSQSRDNQYTETIIFWPKWTETSMWGKSKVFKMWSDKFYRIMSSQDSSAMLLL